MNYSNKIPEGSPDITTIQVNADIAEFLRPKIHEIIENELGWCNELYMTDPEAEKRLEDKLVEMLKNPSNCSLK